jgi:hypothetical protein
MAEKSDGRGERGSEGADVGMTGPVDSPSVDVYLRSLSPPAGTHDRQAEIIDRLSELSSSDRLDSVSVSVWGERVCLCEVCAGTGSGRAALDRLGEFQNWVETVEGGELPFEHRTIRSEYTHTEQGVIVPPCVTMAVYSGDTLVGVFPHSESGETRTVTDALEALEAALEPGRSLPANR